MSAKEEVKRVYSSSFRADTWRNKERISVCVMKGKRRGRTEAKTGGEAQWSEPVAAGATVFPKISTLLLILMFNFAKCSSYFLL